MTQAPLQQEQDCEEGLPRAPRPHHPRDTVVLSFLLYFFWISRVSSFPLDRVQLRVLLSVQPDVLLHVYPPSETTTQLGMKTICSPHQAP